MSKFIVVGGKKLCGDFEPSGNKNEALPVLAAAVLSETPVEISNLPNIKDIDSMFKILETFGVKITKKKDNRFLIDSSQLTETTIDLSMFTSIRGSFLMVVPLLHRFKRVKFPTPGGDQIGRRRLDTHLVALSRLGAEISYQQGSYVFELDTWKAADIFLDEASVMATENAIMGAALADGTSVIYNAACEPHVQGLCHFMSHAGVDIEGIGTNKLTITGCKSLSAKKHCISPDHIEIGSLIGLAAVTHSTVRIKNVQHAIMGMIPQFYKKLGVEYHLENNDFVIPEKQDLVVDEDYDFSIPKIDDSPWPGFPADLISIMVVVATQCRGTVLIFEKMFESRLFWIDKLISMGAGIILCDPHRAVVKGPSELRPQILNSPDIRAGMALLIAAMCANGVSEIHNIHQIDRGYEAIDTRLNLLGAEIQRV